MTTDAQLQLFLNGVWTDVPLLAEPVTITRGTDPFGSWPRPTRFECTINNDSLAYDPTNPEAAIYGVAGRNTRARIRPAGLTRVRAEASEWVPDRTPEHVPGAKRGKSVTNLAAEGLLRRLGRWTDPLRSPMYRTLSGRSTNIGHWSLEETSGATTIANSATGGFPADVAGTLNLGESESPLGAASSLKLSPDTSLGGKFLNASTTAGWQVGFSFRLPAMPTTASYGTMLRWRTSTGHTWQLQVNWDTYRILVLDAEDAVLLTQAAGYAGTEPTQWITMRVKSSQVGGSVQAETAWYRQGDDNEVGITGSYVGTIGALRTWNTVPNAWSNDSWISHVHGATGLTDSLVGSTAQKVFNGYRGEPAGTRFLRLTQELGITRYVSGGSTNTQAMGPQRPDTLLNLLAEIRETDDCRIDDERLDIALTMTTRRGLYNQTPALALTYPDDVAIPFRPVLDDAATRNRVTVENAWGGELTIAETEGAMSVQPPPAGVGEYKHTVNVNVADPEGQLRDIATWHLAKGTLERPRYDSVTVDLIAKPHLEAAATAVREGNIITVAGAEYDTIRLMVVGIQERIGRGQWTITFQTEPGEPYDVGVWDDASFRYDSRSTTLNEALDATETGVDITTADADDAWSTTAVPYDWMVGGERMTATAVTAKTGSGPYTQTATVVRSVNGVTKTHAAGAEVHPADTKRWGL